MPGHTLADGSDFELMHGCSEETELQEIATILASFRPRAQPLDGAGKPVGSVVARVKFSPSRQARARRRSLDLKMYSQTTDYYSHGN